MATVIWNSMHNFVEVYANGEHFAIENRPSYYVNMDQADNWFTSPSSGGWRLPTKKQLLIIAKYIENINGIMAARGGYPLEGSTYWYDESHITTTCIGIYTKSEYTNQRQTCGYARGIYKL